MHCCKTRTTPLKMSNLLLVVVVVILLLVVDAVDAFRTGNCSSSIKGSMPARGQRSPVIPCFSNSILSPSPIVSNRGEPNDSKSHTHSDTSLLLLLAKTNQEPDKDLPTNNSNTKKRGKWRVPGTRFLISLRKRAKKSSHHLMRSATVNEKVLQLAQLSILALGVYQLQKHHGWIPVIALGIAYYVFSSASSSSSQASSSWRWWTLWFGNDTKSKSKSRELDRQQHDYSFTEPVTIKEEEVQNIDYGEPMKQSHKLGSNGKKHTSYKINQCSLDSMPGRRIAAEESLFRPFPTSYNDGDTFDSYETNSILSAQEQPVSTFSVDVDTSSYSYARRQLKLWRLPSPDSIKIEEFVNYFDYEYPTTKDPNIPFQPTVMISNSTWNKGKKLLQIGIKGYDLEPSRRPASNIVFLVDVSGSMHSPDKLPLAKQSIHMLLDTMNSNDTVSMVTYASDVNVVLRPTEINDNSKTKIRSILDSLQASDGTWGIGGIEIAYQLAEKYFDKDAVNRIMLVTDGDFNIGLQDSASLKTYIETKREAGIYLSVSGFGMGNYKDTTMKALANYGNGIAAYIDSIEEAKKVMITEATSNVFPIAKDVKVQIEFNPNLVREYQLIGYEKRMLRREDFNNDKVDAAEVGSGHTVTAIYEITPIDGSGEAETRFAVDPLRYVERPQQKKPNEQMGEGESTSSSSFDDEYAFLKVRYKLPNEFKSKLITRPVTKEDHVEFIESIPDDDDNDNATDTSKNRKIVVQEFNFATAVASFAQLLKLGGRDILGSTTPYDSIIELAEQNIGEDIHGYRKEFINLVRTAKMIADDQYSTTKGGKVNWGEE